MSFKRVYGTGIFRVTFVDGITESWYTSDNITEGHYFDHVMPPIQWFKDRAIPTHREFETNPLNDDYEELQSYFMVSKRDYNVAGFCEVRLKIHEIVCDLMAEGWRRFKYPIKSLKRDYESLRSESLTSYWEGMHRISPYRAPRRHGRLLLLHFNDVGDIKDGYRQTLREAWYAVPLYRAINRIVDSNHNITRSRIIHTMMAIEGENISGPRLPIIGAWRALFSKLKLPAVHDLDPNYGEKAVAAAICNIGYSFEKQCNNDLLNFIGSRSGTTDTTIITNLKILSDDELNNRIKNVKTSRAIAIVTKEQLVRLKPIQQFEIRLDPIALSNVLHMAVWFQI